MAGGIQNGGPHSSHVADGVQNGGPHSSHTADGVQDGGFCGSHAVAAVLLDLEVDFALQTLA